MSSRRTILGALGGTALVGGGAYAAVELFAPEAATTTTETLTGGATALKTGTFTGKAGHECSGTVTLAEDDQGFVLQFRDYQQTQGPDVFCYLTPGPDPDQRDEIAAGSKLLIDGGADGGEITLTGTFEQRVPDDVDVDPAAARGVGIWCDRFSVPFGAATLSEA